MKYVQMGLLLAVLLFSGCRRGVPLKDGRAAFGSSGLSVTIPENWKANRLSGILYPVISTDKDYGLEPNIFVDYVEENVSVDTLYEKILNQRKNQYKGYETEESEPFVTTSGLTGIRSVVKENKQAGLPMTHVHYVIDAGEYTVSMTATCSKEVSESYLDTFDEIVKSLQAK